ncbi:MAG: rod shape-determining protein [Oscillospiraceae bacterium]|jgi:rod shape-determining protein MreB|nr:rod shape-determining protein [Oscillospiraceae bacterium]
MLSKNIGIDLGTTSVQFFVQGRGVVVDQPSVAAYETKTGELVATGHEALAMYGKTPRKYRVVKPMGGGVVEDFDVIRHILRIHLDKLCKNMLFKPNIVVCVPSSVTLLEQRTILDLVTASGAAKVCLIEEPLAAAIGAGLSFDRPGGCMVVDIGGGTTDIAVLTMGQVSLSRSVKTAGNALDAAIMRWCRRTKRLVIGPSTAERVKKLIGYALPLKRTIQLPVGGKDRVSGQPKNIVLSSDDIYEAMRDRLDHMSESIREVLLTTPPELAGDIVKNGILLTGGGAMLRGLDEMLRHDLKTPVRLAKNPRFCVAMGTGRALKNIDALIRNGHQYRTREELLGYTEE